MSGKKKEVARPVTDGVVVHEAGALRPKSLEEIEEQIKLLAEFGLSPMAVEFRQVVVLENGEKRLRKREKPLKIYPDESKYFTLANDTRLPSERMYQTRRTGRYNDEERATAVSFVEVKETLLSVAAFLALLLPFWLFLAATPEQSSAEADLAAAQLGQARLPE